MIKLETGERLRVRFRKQTVPSLEDPQGNLLRQLVLDVIEIYQVNRKECARILLDLGKWLGKGILKGQKGWRKASGEGGEDEEMLEEGSWVLENILIEVRVLCHLTWALWKFFNCA
jgi:nuclear cap-binding protein subunit 1